MIAFDAAVNGGIVNPGTSRTWSHTCTGSDRILFVAVFGDLLTSDATGAKITGATYNGVAMTLLDKVTPPASGERWLYLYYLINPDTGANNVVVSASSSIVIAGNSASYTGVNQSGQPDATNKGTASSTTSITRSLTTIADNCWTFMAGKASGGNVTAGSGSTMRSTENNDLGIFDSNGAITPAGSTSMTMNSSITTVFSAVMASFSPSGGGAPPATTPRMTLLGAG